MHPELVSNFFQISFPGLINGSQGHRSLEPVVDFLFRENCLFARSKSLDTLFPKKHIPGYAFPKKAYPWIRFFKKVYPWIRFFQKSISLDALSPKKRIPGVFGGFLASQKRISLDTPFPCHHKSISIVERKNFPFPYSVSISRCIYTWYLTFLMIQTGFAIGFF